MKRTDYNEEELKLLDKRLTNPAFRGMVFNNALHLVNNGLDLDNAINSVIRKYLIVEKKFDDFVDEDSERTIIKG